MVVSMSSKETTLKDAKGVEPGCVEIIPRNLVTLHVLVWLYSEQTIKEIYTVKPQFNVTHI